MVVTPKTELARIELASQLEETLGTDTARNLMAHIPPINIEQLATKNDLLALPTKDDLLEFATKNDLLALPTKDDITLVKKDVDMVRNDLGKDIDTVRNEVEMLRKDVEMVETRLDTKIDRLDSKVDAGFKEIRSEMVLGFAQQSKKIFTIGLSLALPTWIALIGILITLVITITT